MSFSSTCGFCDADVDPEGFNWDRWDWLMCESCIQDEWAADQELVREAFQYLWSTRDDPVDAVDIRRALRLLVLDLRTGRALSAKGTGDSLTRNTF